VTTAFFPLTPGPNGHAALAGAPVDWPAGAGPAVRHEGPHELAGGHGKPNGLSVGHGKPNGLSVGHGKPNGLSVGHGKPNGLSVGMVSLGCPKNLVDGEVMLGYLQAAGYRVTTDADAADILIVNTCAFIREAKEESVDAILEMAARKREGRCRALVVAGCLPQRYRGELFPLLPEVDAFVGTGEYPGIADVCAELLRGTDRRDWAQSGSVLHHDLMPRLRSTPPHFAYVKISEGCDHQCTFCAIPGIRGRHASRPAASVVAEVRRLAAEGVREVSLVAQDSTAYGRDRGEREGLAGLLQALAAVEGIEWIRLHYAYPASVTPGLIRAMAEEPKVCRYLDIPLQHLDDAVLRAMGRGGTGDGIRRLLGRFRQAIPDLTIRTSFIVGFPGETEARFETLLRGVEALQFDRVGVFAYSPEEGTGAEGLGGQVPRRAALARRRRLMAVAERVAQARGRRLVGTMQRILVDGPSAESPLVMQGRTAAHAYEVDGVVFLSGGPARPGTFVQGRIVAARGHDLVAEVLEDR
jgi:ribosomal protein S12 methylthiotransferase